MVKPSKIFEVFESGKDRHRTILTESIVPGVSVYGEKLLRDRDTGKEYREWNPRRSKLAAAILCNAQNIGIRKGDIVLYLGASTGTTVSHVSDMVGKEGMVFALDFAPRVLRELIFLAKRRKNIAPILGDANNPMSYADKVCMADVVYMDVAQRNQAEIFIKNCRMFLKPGGYGLLALKARSVDVAVSPKKIFKDTLDVLEKEIRVIDHRIIEPFQMDHAMFICKKNEK